MGQHHKEQTKLLWPMPWEPGIHNQYFLGAYLIHIRTGARITQSQTMLPEVTLRAYKTTAWRRTLPPPSAPSTLLASF